MDANMMVEYSTLIWKQQMIDIKWHKRRDNNSNIGIQNILL